MEFPQPLPLKELADWLSCAYVGPASHSILGINEIHRVRPGDLVFVDHPKYYDQALRSDATTILINKKVDCPPGKALLLSEDPFRDFNRITTRFKNSDFSEAEIPGHAKVGPGTKLLGQVHLAENVEIGADCLIHPNVTIYPNTIIGNRVVIHANTVIGADAFYYKKRPEGYDQLKSGGAVHIEDDVHIGALCSIDRGVSEITRIGKGSKLDNGVQIGHDTHLGENCLLAAQVGIAGCVTIGKGVTLWGQVGIGSGVSIGDQAVILGQAGVTKSLAGETTYFGSPAENVKKKYREMAALRRLPSLIEKL